MKFYFAFVLTLLVTLLMASPAHAVGQSAAYNAEFSLNHGSGFSIHELGTKVIEDKVWDLKVTYDFAKSGGAISTITLPRAVTPGNNGATSKGTLPKNAIVMGCYIDVITSLTSSGTTTVSVSTGKTAADLKTAAAYSGYSGIMACIPTGSAASSIKLTADVNPSIAIAGSAALTAGKFNVHVLYILSD